MAGKRQATSNLNHDNWDQEEEPEQRGTFKSAPPEELKSRVFKTATRRSTAGAGDAGSASPSKSVFSGFSGFNKPAAPANAAPGAPFAFLDKLVPSTTVAIATVASTPTATSSASSIASATKVNENIADGKPKASIDWGSIKPLSKDSTSAGNTSSTTSIFGNSSAISSSKSAANFKSPDTADKPTLIRSSGTQEYLDNVADLNKAFVKFLQENVEKNPYCLLSPVFGSYEGYVQGLQQKDSKETKDKETTSLPKAATTTASAPSSTFTFASPTTTSSAKRPNCTVTSGSVATTMSAPSFSFRNIQKPVDSASDKNKSAKLAPPASIFSMNAPLTSTESVKESSPKQLIAKSETATSTNITQSNGLSFGLKSDDKPSTSTFMGFNKPPAETKAPGAGFFFGSATTPFSMASCNPPPSAPPESSESSANEADEDQPPKVEFKQVVEDDATFSKRCKVFVKKDNDFKDRGVGTLYLKPVKDSNKTQMLVRADTNLGNILINVLLAKGIPSQRMGKNNVMMVCVPTPEETKPMSILLRVKTGEEADELLKQIEKHAV
ncbi:Nup50 [Drosophila busckii]|uniref:Nup50 n=1 Tax=Drosophila busckii TaxID=30019 RepID=A0A0M4ET03_DROBS|nr:nuclear pore complex protein Nup50 [Drosophila busckii]ALC40562.1 Nup50 [Drosophila busckii]